MYLIYEEYKGGSPLAVVLKRVGKVKKKRNVSGSHVGEGFL